ncbi:MAG: FtsX-like permease family protein [Luteitalea sp.]|nr:FtsX-like permease family protein [Luteitalea sp.]
MTSFLRRFRRDLGHVRSRWEDARTLPAWSLLEQLAQDARYTLRSLRRSPGFASVAILTLALGIGVNTAIFSVINAVVLRPLPYRDPATLVLVDTGPLSLAPTWLTTAWRDRARTLSDFAGFNGPRAATLVHGGASQQIDAAEVTWNFLSLLGVTPIIGRDFAATDGGRGAPAVGMLSHDFWRRAFGSDPAIVGKTLTTTGNPVTIVGVAPAGFLFPAGGSLPATGMPTDTQPDVLRVANLDASVKVIGRLAPGSTPASATGELLAIFKQEAGIQFSGDAIERWELNAALLHDRLVGNVRQRLWLVMGAVGFVMLVACANVASLLLARASTRQRELVVRMALGARWGRLARLVLTESLLLALLGSAVALLLTYTTRGVARTLLADRLPHVDAIPIDASVFIFNVAIAVATGMLCGLVSLPGVRPVSMASIVGSGAPTVTGRNRVRRVLLSAETAVTFVLVVAAALFGQTLWNLSAQDRGFDADRLLTVRVSPGLPAEIDQDDFQAGSTFFALFFSDLRDRLERIPGVASAAAISLGPLDGIGAGFGNLAVDGRTVSAEESRVPVAFVTPGYFRTLRIPRIRGRDFTERDRAGARLVAIVNEAFQRRFVPNGDILGARVTSGSGPEVFTIVGVSQDVPDRSLRQPPEPLLIAPLSQMPGVHISWRTLTFVLRTAESDPLRLAPEVRRTIWAIDPNIVIKELATMNARIAVAMRGERDSALLLVSVALAATWMPARRAVRIDPLRALRYE